MAITKNTKAFYNTEIPSDWEVKELGEIGELKNGINKEKEDFGFGFPMVNLMDVFGISKVFKNNFNLGLVNANERDIKEYSLLKGDVLFIRSSVKPEGVGLTTVICDDLENTTYCGFIIRFRDNGSLDLEYKAHCFFEEGFRRRLLNKSTISANTNINQGALNSLKIPLPSLPEQKAIAQVLSTADAAIHTTEKLIAKKELRKKWLMQQLLSEKRIVKNEKWCNSGVKEVFLKDVAKVTMGQSPNSEDYNTDKDGLPLIQGNADLNERKQVVRYWTSQSNKECDSGDIIMTVRAPVGAIGLATQKSSIGRGVCSIKPKNIDYWYLYHLLVYKEEQWKKLEQGSTFTAVGSKDIFHFPLFIVHSLEEQTAIAKVLQAADKEISLIKAKAQKLREQKKGLMQVLLTGKGRLKINNE